MKSGRCLKCDILCIQETNFSAHSPPKFYHPHFPTIFCSKAPKKKIRVAIIINDSLKLIHLESYDLGTYLILVCEISNDFYTLASVYALNVKKIPS